MAGGRIQILKKLLVIISILFLSHLTFAVTLEDIKIELISTVAHAIIDKKIVKVYINDDTFLSKYHNKHNLIFVESCNKSDLIITKNIQTLNKICTKKPIFITTYKGYKSFPMAIGALFWQKGRPVLIFRKTNLEKRHINLPKGFQKYIDD